MKKLTICLVLFLCLFAFQPKLIYAQGGGKLYVTMAHRKAAFGGTLISINTDGTGYLKLYSFDPPGGFQPQGGTILAADGRLYGTTAGGGSNGYGVVYSVKTDGSGYSELHGFGDQRADGVNPYCKLLQGTDGKLYGNTNQGGLYDQGTIFSIGTDGNSFLNLLRFDGDNGVTPYYVPQIQDANGILYGITPGGGANHYYGVIYSIHTDGTGYTKLHDFAGSDGANPFSLLQGSDGKLYGTTYGGGATGDGAIFSINPDGTEFSLLFSFNYANGDGQSSGVLMQGSDGKLYGTTVGGGGPTNDGVLFSINKDGSGYSELHLFDRSSKSPYTITEGEDEKIYGVTQFGGGNDDGGIIYSINRDGSGYQKLMDCVDSTGMFPTGILFQGSVSNQPKISQTIAFDSISTKTLDANNFALIASASSGLPLSFRSSDSTIASVSGDTVTLRQTGSVIITASQAGNATYYPATPVTRMLTITSEPPAADAPSGEGECPKEVSVKTFPNPFSDHFSLQVQGDHQNNHQQEVEVTVIDFTGRVVDHGTAQTDQPIEFGVGYKAGLYIIQLSLGDKLKTMKLYKLE